MSLNISITPLLVLFIFSLYFYRDRYKYLSPNIKFIKFKYSNKLLNIGIQFFIIQTASVILFASDNFIISQVLSPSEVTPYNISYQYFSIVTFGFNIITTPLWSSFAEAYVKKDLLWIENNIKKTFYLWVFLVVVVVVMLIFSQNFYELWIGNKIIIPFRLSLLMAIFVILLTFNMIFVTFINGAGKLRVQMYSSIFTIIINIPLCLFFLKYMNLGSVGVMLATCISLSYSIILRPLQCYKLLRGKSKGIWDK